jgi:hypothetical protein
MNAKPDASDSAVETPAVKPFTRRTFMKTSALTIGAVAMLSQGKALGEGNNLSSTQLFHLETNRIGRTIVDPYNEKIGDQISSIWGNSYETKLKWWTNPPTGWSKDELSVQYAGELYPLPGNPPGSGGIRTTAVVEVKGVLPDDTVPFMIPSYSPLDKVPETFVHLRENDREAVLLQCGHWQPGLSDEINLNIPAQNVHSAPLVWITSFLTIYLESIYDANSLVLNMDVKVHVKAKYSLGFTDHNGADLGNFGPFLHDSVATPYPIEIVVKPD